MLLHATAPRAAPALPLQGRSAGLAKGAVSALAEAWPRWRVIQPGDRTSPCGGGPPATLPLFDDFDGDTAADIAAWIDPGDGSAPRLVILLKRVERFQVHVLVVESGGPPPAVQIAPRGMRYVAPNIGIDRFVSSSTALLTTCDGHRILFPWIGTGFDRVDLGATPASAP
jgi:hypothetical protein